MAEIKDKKGTKTNIFFNKINNDNKNKIRSKTKDIKCPVCGELIRIHFQDYKITLFGCKNNHKIDKLFLNEYENSQKKDFLKIICNKCELNKNNWDDIKFYKCFTCKSNLCKLCKLNHDEGHNIINYDKLNCKCSIHNENYNSYCNNCKMNLCILCEKDHINHNIVLFKNILKKDDFIL